ncbi:MAG: hypothetical protein IBX72_14510 [Nitrospirae bacterium]|nr:hypothetical protein [Nitrospirota bacterium]
MSKIKEFLSQCESTGSGSYSVPKEKIVEFIGLLKDVEIAEESHFGPLDYFMADRHTYYHGKSSFHMDGNRLFIGDYYTGCDLSDPEFEKLRINTYGNYYDLLFDYLVNGRFSEKCLTFTVGKKGTNSSVSQEIQQFRAKCNTGNEKEALKHLTTARIISTANESYCGLTAQDLAIKTVSLFVKDSDVYVTNEKFADKVCRFIDKDTVVPVGGKLRINTGKCLVLLNPHPLSYDEVESLRKVVAGVSIPSVMLIGVYYEPELKEILIQYADLDNFTEEIIIEVYNRVFNSLMPDAKAGIRAFKEADALLDYKDGLDVYDIFAGCWMSDFEQLPRVETEIPSSDYQENQEAEEVEEVNKVDEVDETGSISENLIEDTENPPETEIEYSGKLF